MRGVLIGEADFHEWFGRRLEEAAACLANPGGIVCLFSATNFHKLCDDDPPQIWLPSTRSAGATQSATRSPGSAGPARS